ncbi:MAG: hypothetical protein WD382_10270, partial [Halofilum sp. (in: g-proteobacteria)]
AVTALGAACAQFSADQAGRASSPSPSPSSCAAVACAPGSSQPLHPVIASGAAMAALFLSSAASIVRQSLAELTPATA